jgi:hypothetical protein
VDSNWEAPISINSSCFHKVGSVYTGPQHGPSNLPSVDMRIELQTNWLLLL